MLTLAPEMMRSEVVCIRGAVTRLGSRQSSSCSFRSLVSASPSPSPIRFHVVSFLGLPMRAIFCDRLVDMSGAVDEANGRGLMPASTDRASSTLGASRLCSNDNTGR